MVNKQNLNIFINDAKKKTKLTGKWVSEVWFNIPPTSRPHGDGTSVYNLIQKTGEAGGKIREKAPTF